MLISDGALCLALFFPASLVQRTTSLDLALDLLHPLFKIKLTLALQLLLWMRVISTIGCELFLKVYLKETSE